MAPQISDIIIAISFIWGLKKRAPSEYLKKKKRRIDITNRVYSETLDEMLRIKMSTHAMRCMDKDGGLDDYVLSKKRKDQDSVLGEELKLRIVSILKARAERGDNNALAKLTLAGVSGYRVANPEERVRELLETEA